MQISITNGTLTQVQETLSPSTGYVLPASVTVTGATANYSSSTGVVTLTSPTSTMSITASGEASTPSSSITIGNLNISSMSLGNQPITAMYFGTIKIYEASTPTPSGYSVTLSYTGPYSAYFYDGENNTGTLLAQLFDNESQTVTCTSGKIYIATIGGVTSISYSNGASEDNPSTITASGATISVVGNNSGGGGN